MIKDLSHMTDSEQVWAEIVRLSRPFSTWSEQECQTVERLMFHGANKIANRDGMPENSAAVCQHPREGTFVLWANAAARDAFAKHRGLFRMPDSDQVEIVMWVESLGGGKFMACLRDHEGTVTAAGPFDDVEQAKAHNAEVKALIVQNVRRGGGHVTEVKIPDAPDHSIS